MAVDDHGLEVLKKSAEEVSSGDKSNYYIKVSSGTPSVNYDYIDVQQTSSTVETFVFKSGGSGGTTVKTITLTYTDSSKTDIDSVAWT